MMEDLLTHVFPRMVRERNLRVAYTLCLGGLAFTALLALSVSGLLLLFYYRPAPESAYASVLFLEQSVWAGQYVRSFHRLSSHALLLLVAAHVLRVILTGAFLNPRRLNWVVGCLLLFLSVAAAYTGYLLPMDQLAYWATQTGMELLRTLPFGGLVRDLLVPDQVGGALSLLRFYVLHVAVLPLMLASLSMLHFFIIRRQKGVLPYL